MTILCIIGPTASGKTAAAAETALRFGGEVVSCDSVQIYRGFDVGTAKPSAGERLGVPHHMLDVAEPEEEWSAGRYARAARVCVEDVLSRGKLPVVTGGSGFYLRALTDGLTGLPPAPADWSFVLLGLHPPRGVLEQRIRERAAAMLRNGLIEETRALLRRGVPEDCPPMRSIGYLQARAVLNGTLEPERAGKEIALRTRQYAKRQRTWFFNQTRALWLENFSQNGVETVETLCSL
ncbi:MAG: tRNA (adenosine(37)-N6)-dimethylallyltransferase MiaA [Oscillospiraceae bacterium]|jgi:tRNA A37 N6-isopentenylltransferase MiaA|nr:tRNA (adenosine(37)-N6)-dimethylallyltransferase MiaA [Oscillospiraceae bacterium]